MVILLGDKHKAVQSSQFGGPGCGRGIIVAFAQQRKLEVGNVYDLIVGVSAGICNAFHPFPDLRAYAALACAPQNNSDVQCCHLKFLLK
ncbi:hypothetical protein D3C71_1903820 [compost metagenome]